MAFSEEAIDADTYDAADAPKPPGWDAVDAAFIFLNLLELDAKRLAELHLSEPAKLPPAPNGAPNGYIVFGRFSAHTALQNMPLKSRPGLAITMRIPMP